MTVATDKSNQAMDVLGMIMRPFSAGAAAAGRTAGTQGGRPATKQSRTPKDKQVRPGRVAGYRVK